MDLYHDVEQKIYFTLKYGMHVLLMGYLGTAIPKYFEAFGFVDIKSEIIAFKEHLEVMESKFSHRNKPIQIPQQYSLRDSANIQMYILLDPLKIIEDHILTADYEVPSFWSALNDKIKDTIYLPIIKYLLLRSYIVREYCMCDIAEHIMMKYFETEYNRISNILC